MPITVITLSADGSTVATKACSSPTGARMAIAKHNGATVAFQNEAGSLTLPRLAVRLQPDPLWDTRLKAWKQTDPDLTVYVIDLTNTNQSLQAQATSSGAAPSMLSSSSLSPVLPSPAVEVVKVGTFCRNVAGIGVDTVEYRLLLLTDAVQLLALSSADVVMLPEYFFTKSSDAITSLQTTKETVHYSTEEFAIVSRAATALAARYPSKLIVCGTVLWSEAGTLRNTCLVCLNGRVLRYDKAFATEQEDGYARGHKLKTAPQGKLLPPLMLGPFKCLIEICLDNSSESASGQLIDLHLVPSYGGGGVRCKAHKGGWSVECDGAGAVKLRQGGVRTAPTFFKDDGERVLTLNVIPAHG